MKRSVLFLFCVMVWSLSVKAQQKTPLNQSLNKAARMFKVKFTYEHSLVNGTTVIYDESALKNEGLEKTLNKWFSGTELTFDAIGEKYFTIIKKRQIKMN